MGFDDASKSLFPFIPFLEFENNNDGTVLHTKLQQYARPLRRHCEYCLRDAEI